MQAVLKVSNLLFFSKSIKSIQLSIMQTVLKFSVQANSLDCFVNET